MWSCPSAVVWLVPRAPKHRLARIQRTFKGPLQAPKISKYTRSLRVWKRASVDGLSGPSKFYGNGKFMRVFWGILCIWFWNRLESLEQLRMLGDFVKVLCRDWNWIKGSVTAIDSPGSTNGASHQSGLHCQWMMEQKTLELVCSLAAAYLYFVLPWSWMPLVWSKLIKGHSHSRCVQV